MIYIQYKILAKYDTIKLQSGTQNPNWVFLGGILDSVLIWNQILVLNYRADALKIFGCYVIDSKYELKQWADWL